MATDSTELTFVRCPSCRSLVPAVSSRCRMCGAGLDPADEMSGESDEEEKQPPVADEQPAAEASEASSNGHSADSDAPGEDEGFDDPLGSYMEDVEGGESEESGAEESVAEEPAPEPSPKLKVESGRKKGGLSFRKDGEQRKGEKASEEAAAPTSKSRKQEPPKRERRSAPEESTPRRERREKKREARAEEPLPDSRKESRGKKRAEQTPAAQESSKRAERPPRKERRERASQSPQKEQTGRLFGWLVTFENSNGEGLEIREGKFFVTGASLKGNDLVLDRDSISTPHALVAVSGDRGLVVQDLMSEEGVFVRQSGEGSYRREEEPVQLEHGDRIRFGEQEFLVSLLPDQEG